MARRKDPASETDGAAEAEAILLAEAGPEAGPDSGPEASGPEAAVELPAESPLSMPVPGPVRQRSGLPGAILGGALAAVGGFALSHFNALGLAPQDQSQALAAFDQRLTEGLAGVGSGATGVAAVQADLAALADRVAGLEAAPAAEPPDLSQLDGLDARLAAIEALPAGGDASTAALAAKLAALERQLAAQPAAVDQGQVDAALARLDAAEAEATQRGAEALAAADAMAQSAALTRLQEAVATGGAFQAELAAISDPALTQALEPHVAGVATLSDLQAEFPEAARLTLKLARDAAGEQGWGARFVDFLTAQTGARSLTPREGTDPDAILSRAEFALGEGRLADALAELGTLDAALQAPFQDWNVKATVRLAVDKAIAAAQEAR